MATGKSGESTTFLSRWSQRKRKAEEAAQNETPETDVAEGAGPQSAQAAEVEPIDPATLPDIESLTAGSDFSVFMRPGVPEALKQRALRRLWQVNPAFHVICPLDDYNLDYTDAATVVPNLKTLYQVGRGMVLPEAEAEEEETGPAAGAAAPLAAPGQRALAPLPMPEQSQASKQEAVAKSETQASTVESPATGSVVRVENERERVPSPSKRNATRRARLRRWGDTET